MKSVNLLLCLLITLSLLKAPIQQWNPKASKGNAQNGDYAHTYNAAYHHRPLQDLLTRALTLYGL